MKEFSAAGIQLDADGCNLGLEHGSYHRFDEKEPMSYLFVSMLNAIDVPTDNFADSTGALSSILKQLSHRKS